MLLRRDFCRGLQRDPCRRLQASHEKGKNSRILTLTVHAESSASFCWKRMSKKNDFKSFSSHEEKQTSGNFRLYCQKHIESHNSVNDKWNKIVEKPINCVRFIKKIFYSL